MSYIPTIGKRIGEEVDDELARAKKAFPRPFASPHEGFAILKEEVDELWMRIMKNNPPLELRHEAVQIAAMAIRFIQEVCG